MNQFAALALDHRIRLGVSWSLSGQAIMGLRNRGAKGNGAIALREICALADSLGVVLTLATSVAKLKPYYERFGFVPTATLRNGNYCATSFRRQPQRGRLVPNGGTSQGQPAAL